MVEHPGLVFPKSWSAAANPVVETVEDLYVQCLMCNRRVFYVKGFNGTHHVRSILNNETKFYVQLFTSLPFVRSVTQLVEINSSTILQQMHKKFKIRRKVRKHVSGNSLAWLHAVGVATRDIGLSRRLS